MDDFIFGSLSNDELRLRRVRFARLGVTHLQHRTPLDPLPGQSVTVELTIGPDHPFEKAWLYWTDDGSDPEGSHGQAVNGFAAPLQFVKVEWDTLVWGYVRQFCGVIPAVLAGCIVRYRLSASDEVREIFADEGAYYAFYVADDPTPAWAQSAIIYQIFTDRFFSSTPGFPHIERKPSLMCNGNLQGITAKLAYLASLGINCLWLTPIFPSPSYHGYDATSFMDINPRFGTDQDFKELIQQAHARGIRILLDFVPNHWSNLHPSFIEAQKDQNSPFSRWYTFHKWPHDYKSFFGVKTLPQINLRDPEARQHVLSAVKYWLEFGVDGFRVDYCIGPSPDFFAEFRRTTRLARPDCWTFGEAIDPPDAQLAFWGGMDGSLDFMLLEAFRLAFASQKWTARRFNDFLDRHEAYFPAVFSRPSFLDNHDMNRFLWVAGGDKRKLRLAALCQFTLRGAPIIYYGTEVGLSQHRDMRQDGRSIHEEGRLPMLWDSMQDTDLLRFYTGLCHLRIGHPALCSGSRTTLHSDDTLLAYRRADSHQSLVTVLNLSNQPAVITLSIPERTLVYATTLECRLEAAADGVRVNLPALGGMVII